MQILKEETFESLVDQLRNRMIEMRNSTAVHDVNGTYEAQRKALIALSDVGELLVQKFPFNVPEDGKYANLPRLLGRCKVTFSFSRNNKPIGDVTVIADGFAAPLTAGNFIDLCLRNFYVGLPIMTKKKDLNVPPITEQMQDMNIRAPSVIVDTIASITDKFDRTIDKESLIDLPVFGESKLSR